MKLIALLVPIVLAGLVQAWLLIRTAIARNALKPRGEAVAVGAATNFFDTLGIGSFAPTLAWLKLRSQVPDRLIPCTMLVAHGLPVIVQAIIFLILLGVAVDPILIAGFSIALLVGGVVGAPLALRMPIWIVQSVVAAALLIAALLYSLSNLDLMPVGGTASSLPLSLTIVAIAGNFVMGVLLNFGVGHYAPSLIMLSFMGMDPRLAFPIMATAGAVTVAGISTRHIPAGNVDLRTVVSFAIGGIPAVLLAAFVVKSMPVVWLRWLVILVVVYAATTMIRDARRNRREAKEANVADVAPAGSV